MKLKITQLGAVLLFVSQGAMALPEYDDLTNAGNSNNRGIWTGIGRFSTESGSFSVTGNTATLAGDVFSTDFNGGLIFDIDMTYLCSSSLSDEGGNSVSINNGACSLGNQPTGGAVLGSDVNDGRIWDFWNWTTSSTLIGYGGLDGLVIDISQAPTGGT